MGYIVLAVICFVAGYVLGVFSAKKAKQELNEALVTLNSKVDGLQEELNKKVEELNSRIARQ